MAGFIRIGGINMFIDCPYVNCEGTGMGFKCNQNLMSCDRCTIAHPELIKKEEPTKKKSWFKKLFGR